MIKGTIARHQRWHALGAFTLSACFHPTYDHPACGPGASCPNGLSCVAGTCETAGSTLPIDGGGQGPIVGTGRCPMDGQNGGTGGGACASFATLLPIDTCQLSFDSDLVIPDAIEAEYNTGTHALTLFQFNGTTFVQTNVPHTTLMVGGSQVEVISARTVTLTGTVPELSVSGSVPLVIAASTDIILDGSSGSSGYGHIWVNPESTAPCIKGATAGASNGGSGGGGGGGGFGADGGRGGEGNSGGTGSIGGTNGLAVAGVPPGLRGGCPGANGGDGASSVGAGGMGGTGGGGLYLVAAHCISLGGGVYAEGLGGRGGFSHVGGGGGGGGGGSGGMMLLEAPHIVGPQATVSADGGGGGGGASPTNPGEDGRGYLSGSGAGGSTSGGSGGSKENGTTKGQDVTAVATAGGGGGGGGGAGIIRVKSADLQIKLISPDPQ